MRISNDDTIKLLRECSAGIKMAVDSIDEIMPYVENENLFAILSGSKSVHEQLGAETGAQLESHGSGQKEPNPMAKGMSWVKTNVKMAWNPHTDEVADLMTDGCGMGIKSLSKYLNKYAASDPAAKDIAQRTIKAEDDLVVSLRAYL